MSGKLIWLVGFFGFGKDSLLVVLCQCEYLQLLVVYCYIICLFNVGSENYIVFSEYEFFICVEQYFFVFSWYVNNIYYGIGVEIDFWLYVGFDVVVNGFCVYLVLVWECYGEVLVLICFVVLLLVLCQWLEQCGWENVLEIVQCLECVVCYKLDNCLILNNDGSF